MNIKNIIKFIGIFFLYLLSDLVYLIPLSIFNINLNDLSISLKLILSISADLFVTICLFLIYKEYLIKKFHDFKENFNNYFETGLKYWLLGLLIMYCSNFLLSLLTPAKEAINESNVQALINASPWLTMILTTIFAPINEELIFRKSIRDFIKHKWLFIIISAFIFGYLHVSGGQTLYDYLYIIPYGALGGVFAALLVKTDNIYSTIMVHLIHNGILTILSILI